jgi:osmotically-inducible protein OsmY
MLHKIRLGLACAALVGLLSGGSGCAVRGQAQNLDMSDPGITARVKAELKSHRDINVRYLDVSTHMGIVTLSGMADYPEARRQITRIVGRVPGVKQLIVNLLIQE